MTFERATRFNSSLHISVNGERYNVGVREREGGERDRGGREGEEERESER